MPIPVSEIDQLITEVGIWKSVKTINEQGVTAPKTVTYDELRSLAVRMLELANRGGDRRTELAQAISKILLAGSAARPPQDPKTANTRRKRPRYS